MPKVRCEDNKHDYNTDQNSKCPYCRAVPKTRQVASPGVQALRSPAETRPVNQGGQTPRSPAETRPAPPVGGGGTIREPKLRFSPPVGWLVCTDGADKGKDYRIIHGRNLIGRGGNSNIRIIRDMAVSDQEHAELMYDNDDGFLFRHLKGASLAKVNGKSAREFVKIKRGDVIQVGQTMLLFVPLCDENFSWVLPEGS